MSKFDFFPYSITFTATAQSGIPFSVLVISCLTITVFPIKDALFFQSSSLSVCFNFPAPTLKEVNSSGALTKKAPRVFFLSWFLSIASKTSQIVYSSVSVGLNFKSEVLLLVV